MTESTKLESFPWLAERKNPEAKPMYKIVARSMSLGGDSIVTLHKAGESHVLNYYIRELVTHPEIMDNMDQKEADLMRWVVNSEVTNPLKS